MCAILTNWPVSVWYNFLQKSFYQRGYWNLDFNSSNSTKYVQTLKNLWIWQNLRLWKKFTRKLSSWKEMFSWMIWDVWLVRIYIGSFFKLFITVGNDETVNFRNCRKSFSNKFVTPFLWHFGTPFSNGKKETKWQSHAANSSGRHLYIGEVNVATRR